MITKECLTLEWINEVSKKNNADKTLIEKVIRALFLVEGLAESELKFVFKGGTALMLLVGSTKRLSIDVDIIMDTKTKLDEHFNSIVKKKGFIRWELHERSPDAHIEKEHYKFYYNPIIKSNQTEDNILLDILFEKPLYNKTILTTIDSKFVKQEGEPVEVTTPDYNNILGDKLTAFAPETTGIPYERNDQSMAMEIIKQLYDVGTIFNNFSDYSATNQAFHDFAKEQMKDRELGEDINLVLDDIYDTALTLSTRGMAGTAKFDILQQGINKVNRFIFSENYHIEKAITDASKAAYLATLIKHNNKDVQKYSNALEIKDWIIELPFNTRLQKLKKSNPEAFFYWYKIYEIDKEKK